MTDREVLERIADAIVSGRQVDWDASAAMSSPDLRELLGELRVIAGIADLHGTVASRLEGHVTTDDSGAHDLGDHAEALQAWGPLRLIDQVASGAAGTVYRAWDTRLDREVALKLLHDAPLRRETPVVEEGRLLARVRHPNVATVYGAERLDGRTGVWMEFVHGRTLEDIVSRDGPLESAEAVAVIAAVCRALQAVHDAGLLHRDIKTHNVMRESSGRIVLMDFHAGIDSMASPGHMMVGTPAFLAPEVLLEGRPASVQSDIYGVGVLGYRILTGGFPREGRSIDDLRRAWSTGEPVPLGQRLPGLPPGLVSAIERALSRDPDARPATAGKLAAELEPSMAPVAVEAVVRPHPRQRWLWAPALAACAIVGVVLARDVRRHGWPDSLLRAALGLPTGTGTSAGGAPGVPSVAELDWRGFAPTGAPTPDGQAIGGLAFVEPAVRNLVTGEVTVLQKQQHEDDNAGPVAIAPDGTLAAYSWFRARPDGSGRTEIRVAPLTGDESHLVLADDRIANARVVAWTPDLRELLALLRGTDDERTLALVSATSGAVRPLATFPGDEPSTIALSPDGTMVAFDTAAAGNAAARDIHLLDVATGETVPLVAALSNDLYPCWSADGRSIAFASDRDGSLGLWAVGVAAGGAVGQPRLLRSGMGRFRPLGFTANGDFYFASESGTIDVYRVELDALGTIASSPVVVAETFVGRNLDADWSPDGRRIVLVSRRGEVSFDRRSMSLVLRPIAEGPEQRVTPDLDGVHDPRWSPDGRLVLFGGRTGDVDRLYVLDVDTGDVRSLGSDGLGAARWSASGRRIYGVRYRDGRFGLRVRWLRSDSERELAWPVNHAFAVSPDEQWIATTRDTPEATAVAVRAASGGVWHEVFPGQRGDRVFAIDWTRDGAALLVSRVVGSGGGDTSVTEVWAVGLDGATPLGVRRVGEIKGLAGPRKFRVSPDGRQLLFTAGSPAVTTWVMRGLHP